MKWEKMDAMALGSLTQTPLMNTHGMVLCRMKMYEMGKDGRYGIGFIDPNTVNEYTWKIDARHQKAVEDSMLEFLKRLKYNEDILLPYNFQ